MKIEAAKNQTIEKQESKNLFKTETSVFNSLTPPKTAEHLPPPTTSAFSKILEETRKENEKDGPTTAKSDSADHDTKSSKSEKDEKVNRQSDEKKELEERNGQNGDSDARQDGDENPASAMLLAALPPPTGQVAETAAPAARSILHVADLERIISTVRSETLQNQKQVTIALKNSILEGLEIKLTITENGKLKAEFLALNEQIKKQLNQRKNELTDILKNRSALFSEVEVKSKKEDEKG